MNLTILGPRLLATPIVPDRIGAVILPENLRASHVGRYKLWTVLQTGPGRITHTGVRLPLEVQPGDRIITDAFAEGTHTFPDGTVILGEDQIMLVLEGFQPRISEVAEQTFPTDRSTP